MDTTNESFGGGIGSWEQQPAVFTANDEEWKSFVGISIDADGVEHSNGAVNLSDVTLGYADRNMGEIPRKYYVSKPYAPEEDEIELVEEAYSEVNSQNPESGTF